MGDWCSDDLPCDRITALQGASARKDAKIAEQAEAITNLGALVNSAHEVVAEQLEIRQRLEAENAALKERNDALSLHIEEWEGKYRW